MLNALFRIKASAKLMNVNAKKLYVQFFSRFFCIFKNAVKNVKLQIKHANLWGQKHNLKGKADGKFHGHWQVSFVTLQISLYPNIVKIIWDNVPK